MYRRIILSLISYHSELATLRTPKHHGRLDGLYRLDDNPTTHSVWVDIGYEAGMVAACKLGLFRAHRGTEMCHM